MEKYNRKTVFDKLEDYDCLSGEFDFIEVCGWHNGDGFDVEINTKQPQRFQLTDGQFRALKKLVKKLYEKWE